ncbi:MAG: hypothetical protein K6F82_02785 [Sphaerochaetaceae bacterium]|nr:hypothetical protein [Sphaerochaetaceae bacterium]
MKVLKGKLTGYCHGVSQTLHKASSCLKTAKKKNLNCYSIGQLIHNRDVSTYFEEQGLKIIKKPEDGEPGVALIRAHGITCALRRSFEDRGFILEDATCVNIKKTQKIIVDSYRHGRTIILFGVKGHAETVCLQGTEDPSKPGKSVPMMVLSSEEDLENLFSSVDSSTPVTVVVQTTFPDEMYGKLFDAVSSHYPDCKKGNGLCYACIRRKQSAIDLASSCDAVVVVGGRNSENTKDLAKYVEKNGSTVFCIENKNDIDSSFIQTLKEKNIETIGVCSGTSTPPEVIEDVCECLKALN